MGILDAFRRATRTGVDVDASRLTFYGVPASLSDIQGYFKTQDPATLYRQQPNLRTVVTFLARNVAQLGLHDYRRIGDTDRKRERASILARTLKKPNPHMTTYELLYQLVADLALWDSALWLVVEDIESETGWTIQPIPMPWVVSFGGGDIWGPGWVKVSPPGTVGQPEKIPMEDVIYFHGWDPENLSKGVSPVDSLKATISEQIHAAVYREQQWTKAGRAGVVVSRPAEAPTWDPVQKRKFKEILDSKLAGADGSDAGGSVVLEDGMTMAKMGFNAKEQQFIEAAKLAFGTVCQVYHVNPTMVGQLDNANFSNVREFRRALYGETLGPIIRMIEDRLNAFLVPKLADHPDEYLEFNVKEKLRGSFEEEATVKQSATGAPWMTRNEVRAMDNLSAIEGGDELITPLNVLIGGQASPQDSTPDSITGNQLSGPLPTAKELREFLAQRQSPKVLEDLGELPAKARTSATVETNIEKALRSHYERQEKAVLAALGAKDADDWWDRARWDRELTEDLYKMSLAVVTKIGRKTAEELGFDPDVYDRERTVKFLQAVAKSRAEAINAATKLALDEALAAGTPPVEVFDRAKSSRAVAGAAALATFWSAFATTEAAKQISGAGGGQGTKTWVVTSKDPRAAHSAMNGETVPLDSKFSNGADWPGDPVLGADGVAGCKCSVRVEID